MTGQLTDTGKRFLRLRRMLNHHRMTYESIGEQLSISKQRVGQLAQKLTIDGRQWEWQRILHRHRFSDHKDYSVTCWQLYKPSNGIPSAALQETRPERLARRHTENKAY
jgi:hypothetical protein